MKKVFLLILMVLFVFCFVGCVNDTSSSSSPSNNSSVNNTVVKTVTLTKNNYDDYIGFSYQMSVNGPLVGEYGFDYIFNVEVYSLDSNYEFNNVKIVFSLGDSSGYKLASNGNSSFTLKKYMVLNTVTPNLFVLDIYGTVSWEE